MSNQRVNPKTIRITAVIAVIVTMLLSACDWTMGGFDATNANNNASDSTLTTSTVQRLTQRWSIPAGSLVQQPVVVAGAAFVDEDLYDPSSGAPIGSRVAAIDLATGARKWTTATLSTATGSGIGPAVSGSTVLTVSGSRLIALDAATGARRWAASLTGGIARSLLVAGSTVYAGNDAFDVGTGALRWSTDATASVLAVSGGTAYFATIPSGGCSLGGELRALDATTGAVRWSRSLGVAVVGWSGRIVGGTFSVVLLLCRGFPGSGGTAAFDVASGALRWTDPSVAWSLGASGGRLFGQQSGGLGAVTATSGAAAWPAPVSHCGSDDGTSIGTLDVATAGQVAFSTFDGEVCAVNATTGAPLGRWPVPATGGPTIAASGCVLVEGGNWRQVVLTALCAPPAR